MESTASRRYPSFSSTLLDEIYRSIDDDDYDDEQPTHSKFRASFEDDACFIQKWMDNKKPLTGRRSAADIQMRCARCLNSKPIRTGIDDFMKLQRKQDSQTKPKDEGKFVKTRLKALKIYGDLKKVKQPISPGGRLATFLNSLFNNNNNKKPNADRLDRKAKSANASTCSSASSFSRSCLSNTPSSRSNLSKRPVRFYPDGQPCGHKSLHQHLNKLNLSHISEAAARNNYHNKVDSSSGNNINEFENQSDDGGSESSSDLFELENLFVNKYPQELPVYATTTLDSNPLFM